MKKLIKFLIALWNANSEPDERNESVRYQLDEELTEQLKSRRK